jgi:hypothetical protein
MSRFALGFVSLFLLSVSAFATDSFPLGPNLTVTPGELCQQPDEYRYPEHIGICIRNVTTARKNQIIKNYDQMFGYDIEDMNRQDFKIDHYIPLCAGGGNDDSNLWPQHKSVYTITDPLEPLVCQKMSDGVLTQAQAIQFIREGKGDLSKVPGILQQLNALN